MKRQARKKSITKKLSTIRNNDQLERETLKLMRQANSILDSLQRRFRSGTWASKKLANRLSSNKMKMWTKQGKIKFPKNPTKQQVLGLNKAITQFLKSSTSTKKGINQVRRKTIETLQGSLSTPDKEMTYEEAEQFYEMFGDSSFQTLSEKIGASSLQAVIEDSIEDESVDENDFIKRLEIYGGVSMNDLDLRDAAKRLYEKYVL